MACFFFDALPPRWRSDWRTAYLMRSRQAEVGVARASYAFFYAGRIVDLVAEKYKRYQEDVDRRLPIRFM
jgi:hypothetical protein